MHFSPGTPVRSLDLPPPPYEGVSSLKIFCNFFLQKAWVFEFIQQFFFSANSKLMAFVTCFQVNKFASLVDNTMGFRGPPLIFVAQTQIVNYGLWARFPQRQCLCSRKISQIWPSCVTVIIPYPDVIIVLHTTLKNLKLHLNSEYQRHWSVLNLIEPGWNFQVVNFCQLVN